ncbi:V-type proton ATPase catalytic subunit A [Frankliniella fusca]|uniref:V-type proton ATPase catalytic subunit A n=1 Tax=Frankliniella fusca TaxID=407009 RepID=A0AAE1L8V1_9NEOP|nr:V-type proton ATPase catalytic subunit A [Frankliniella fusca]
MLMMELRQCFGEFGLTRNAQDRILALFRARGYPDLPVSSKTLMGTCRSVAHLLKKCTNGKLHYFGIAEGVRQTVTNEYLSRCSVINLDFAFDGLSPYGSVKTKVWPILCRLSATDFSHESSPFVVCVFSGTDNPEPSEFLEDFVSEAKVLQSSGLKINGIRYEVHIQKFVADYPARCRMKCVNGEGPASLVQCERCTIIGKNVDNITHFSSTEVRMSNPTLRTDLTFRQRAQPEYHTHHKKGPRPDSPFLALDLHMLYAFPIDPMHLLYLGIMRRYWEYLISVKKGKYHLTPAKTEEISEFMNNELRHQFPSDFSRRLRGLAEYKSYKATEWRRFLLYDGMLVLRKFLPRPCYKNFLLLSCAVRILSAVDLFQQEGLRSDANVMLQAFVADSQVKFGKNFLTIKMHSLVHLAKDAEMHGVLDSFSAFPFESYLGRINAAMRGHGRCIEQIVGRIREGYLLQPVPVRMRSTERPQPVLSEEVTSGDTQDKREYLQMRLPDVEISAGKMRDSIVMTQSGEVLRVSAIIHDTVQGKIYIVGYKFKHSGDFFRTPIRSSAIGIRKVWGYDSSTERQWHIEEIRCKCVLLQYNSEPKEWLCLPFLQQHC